MARRLKEEPKPVYTGVRANWFSDEETSRHFEMKKAGLEAVLGPRDDTVLHAALPFVAGGALDLYCFRQALPGTVFATMDLIYPDGQGPQANRFGTFELAACTRLSPGGNQYALFSDAANRSRLPYEQTEHRIWRMLTRIGHYSQAAVLKPGDTCEIPNGTKELAWVLLDRFDLGQPFKIGEKFHHLLLCMEIFPVEQEYARLNGPAALIHLLKNSGDYPYTDLDRRPVV